jgi:hypothetical protein
MIDVIGTTSGTPSGVTFTPPVTVISGRTFGGGARGRLGTATYDSLAWTLDSVNGGIVRCSSNSNWGNGAYRGFIIQGFYEVT